MKKSIQVRFMRNLVKDGEMLWARTADRRPLPSDYEPTDAEIKAGDVCLVRPDDPAAVGSSPPARTEQ